MKIDTHHYDGLINHILNEWKIFVKNILLQLERCFIEHFRFSSQVFDILC